MKTVWWPLRAPTRQPRPTDRSTPPGSQPAPGRRLHRPKCRWSSGCRFLGISRGDSLHDRHVRRSLPRRKSHHRYVRPMTVSLPRRHEGARRWQVTFPVSSTARHRVYVEAVSTKCTLTRTPRKKGRYASTQLAHQRCPTSSPFRRVETPPLGIADDTRQQGAAESGERGLVGGVAADVLR